MKAATVPDKVASEAVKAKYWVLDIQHHPENYDQTPTAAKKLGLPLVTIHSPCDEMGRRMLVQSVNGLSEDATVKELVNRISNFPEFRRAETKIEVRLGAPKEQGWQNNNFPRVLH